MLASIRTVFLVALLLAAGCGQSRAQKKPQDPPLNGNTLESCFEWAQQKATKAISETKKQGKIVPLSHLTQETRSCLKKPLGRALLQRLAVLAQESLVVELRPEESVEGEVLSFALGGKRR